nr:hypothetical protein [Nitrosomonas nitrosa]
MSDESDALVRFSKQPVLRAECDWPDRLFGGAIADLDSTVVEEAARGRPARTGESAPPCCLSAAGRRRLNRLVRIEAIVYRHD